MVRFSWWDIPLIFLVFALPYLVPVLLLALACLWRYRRVHRKTFIAVLVTSVLCTGFELVFLMPQWWSGFQAQRELKFWDDVEAASAAGKVAEARRLLDSRGGDGPQEYVSRWIDLRQGSAHPELLRFAFSRCADLLQGGTLGTDLLGRAIQQGKADIVQAWLDSPACPRPDGSSREEILSRFVYHLLPEIDNVDRFDGTAQAAALGVLVRHQPELLQVELSDFGCRRYRGAYAKCTVLAELFDRWHGDAVALLLPLDGKAARHLPGPAVPLLAGDGRAAIAAARADPTLFQRILPSLIAQVPADVLTPVLRAAPPAEDGLMTLTKGNSTMTQQLVLLFEAAKRSDARHGGWAALEMVLGLFPTRLGEVSHDLFEAYLIGTKPKDTRVERLIATLRAGGYPCTELRGLVGWGDSSPEALAWYGDITGCPPH